MFEPGVSGRNCEVDMHLYHFSSLQPRAQVANLTETPFKFKCHHDVIHMNPNDALTLEMMPLSSERQWEFGWLSFNDITTFL